MTDEPKIFDWRLDGLPKIEDMPRPLGEDVIFRSPLPFFNGIERVSGVDPLEEELRNALTVLHAPVDNCEFPTFW